MRFLDAGRLQRFTFEEAKAIQRKLGSLAGLGGISRATTTRAA
jgi:hypothetical protein